jgi:hypothetical protein
MEAVNYMLVSCVYVVSLKDFHIANLFPHNLVRSTCRFYGGFHMSHVTSSCRYVGLVQKRNVCNTDV